MCCSLSQKLSEQEARLQTEASEQRTQLQQLADARESLQLELEQTKAHLATTEAKVQNGAMATEKAIAAEAAKWEEKLEQANFNQTMQQEALHDEIAELKSALEVSRGATWDAV